MIFESPSIEDYNYEQVTNTPAPRCSLDFKLVDDTGEIIDDSQLRLQSFQGHESLSQLFEINLVFSVNDYTSGGECVGSTQPYGAILDPNISTTQTMNFDQMIGSNATILLGAPETSAESKLAYPTKQPQIYFNGIITNFALAERGVYHATMKPALFKLSLQNNYRLFSQCTIIDVIIQVLTENNITFNKTDLEKKPNNIVMGLANYRKQDWLQAGESDLDFILRLMQKVHLFFYFTHEQFQHTMVITDQPYYQEILQRTYDETGVGTESDQLKSLYLSFSQQASLDRDDYITQFKYQQNLTTHGVTTVLAQKQATWESQNTAQVSPVFLNREHQKEKLNFEELHLVQYGASETEVGKLNDVAVNRLAAARFDFSGASSCPELKAGHKFQVKETWQDDNPSNLKSSYSNPLPVRPCLNERAFVVTSVQHQASVNGDYKNQFSAVAAEGLAIPFDSHGTQQGSILAIVTEVPSSGSSFSNFVSAIANFLQLPAKTSHQGSSAKYLEKSVFAFDSKDFKFTGNDGEQPTDTYSCRGIYVRFIDQPDNAPAQWVKLAEHMETIPEIGSYVVVSRSNDVNEIPEVQQSLQAKGRKIIMPNNFSCNTSVGDNYNTNYGDSTRINFGSDIATPLSTAQTIVDEKRTSNQYNDVSYGESSSFGYNVSARNHHISRTGDGADLPYDASAMSPYVQYNNNATYGDSYGESLNNGDTTNHSKTTGKETRNIVNSGGTSTTSETTGGSYNYSSVDTSHSIRLEGASSSESFVGASHSLSITGANSNESVVGVQNSMSATGASNTMSATGASNYMAATGMKNEMTATGLTNSMSKIGVSMSTSIVGSETSISTVTNSNRIQNTTLSMNVSNTTSSNSISNTTEGNSIDVVVSGMQFSKRPPAASLEDAQTAIYTATKVML